MPELCVSISQGRLKGYTSLTDDGFRYNSYVGIPYAKPPTELLRFQDPQPPESWDGIWDATVEGNECPQINKTFTENYSGDEDCLFVNVYAPESAKESDKLPVMVFFHGGAFIMGSGEKLMYGPDYLIEKNVVVVTVNYRLGIFGFLCLNTPEVPGNAGLKDQVLALRWVRNNIKKFGGDSDNVTIFGESAGAGSVHFLMMSPLAKGLFHRAIMQSGCCKNNWAMQYNPEETALNLAEELGEKSRDKDKVLMFLRNVPAEELITKIYKDFKMSVKYQFIPVIEKNIFCVDAFIKQDPNDIMQSGNYNKVPCITGYNSLEGALFISDQIVGKMDVSKLKSIDDLGIGIDFLLPDIVKSLAEDEKNKVIDKLKTFYFTANRSFVDAYVDLMSDLTFVVQIDATAKLMCANSHPIYYYKFGYDGMKNLYKPMITHTYNGACHGDDLSYLFNINVKKLFKKYNYTKDISPTDTFMTKRMVELWTNFAKLGNPTPTINDVITVHWLPMTPDKVNCLDINDKMKMITDPFAERINFWKDLYNI